METIGRQPTGQHVDQTGAPSTPNTQASTKARSGPWPRCEWARVASLRRPLLVAASTGTKAWLKAPSANKRRNKLGMRNHQKASVALAPKTEGGVEHFAHQHARDGRPASTRNGGSGFEQAHGAQCMRWSKLPASGHRTHLWLGGLESRVLLTTSTDTRIIKMASGKPKKRTRAASGRKRARQTSSSTPRTASRCVPVPAPPSRTLKGRSGRRQDQSHRTVCQDASPWWTTLPTGHFPQEQGCSRQEPSLRQGRPRPVAA